MSASLDVVQMTVSHMGDALRFYRMLGMSIPEGQEGEAHVEITLPNGLRFAWDTVALMKEIHPDWQPPVGHRMTLAFRCDSAAGVDALFARLIGAGYAGQSDPWDAFWGQRYAVVLDPDGNKVDLFAPL